VPILARPKDLNDGAIPSGNSVALRVLAMLTRRTDNLSYENRARNTLGALAASVKSYPASYGYLLMGRDELEHGATGSIQYAAKGAVRIIGKMRGNGVVTISLAMKPGWHINAHKPLDTDLIPTTITLPETQSGWSLQSIVYPEPITKTLLFQQQPLALYENTTRLQAQIKANTDHRHLIPLQINLQACNDKHCLAPETITLQISSFLKETL
jgi:DsbC/DsbD-like thiol-disulfide interchange protein